MDLLSCQSFYMSFDSFALIIDDKRDCTAVSPKYLKLSDWTNDDERYGGGAPSSKHFINYQLYRNLVISKMDSLKG